MITTGELVVCKRIPVCFLTGIAGGEGAPEQREFRLGSAADTQHYARFTSCLVQGCADARENQAAALEGACGSVQAVPWKSQSHVNILSSTRFPLDICAVANMNYEVGSSHKARGRRICMWHRQYRGHEHNIYSSLQLSLQLNLKASHPFTHCAGRKCAPRHISNSLLSSLLSQNKYVHITFLISHCFKPGLIKHTATLEKSKKQGSDINSLLSL